jgi:ribonucleoside-diphosphate reductase alpha chain
MIPRERPKILSGRTIMVRTDCGKIYVTLNRTDDGHYHEVFATLGKNGSCTKSQLEAITRSVTLALRADVHPDYAIEELGGIQCPCKSETAKSCADAIAHGLKELVEEDTTREAKEKGAPVANQTESMGRTEGEERHEAAGVNE